MTRPRLLFSLLLFLPVPLFAADVAVDLRVVGTPFYLQPNEVVAEVTNHGPGRATSVVLTIASFHSIDSDDPRCMPVAGGLRCELSSLGVNQPAEVRVRNRDRSNLGVAARVEATVVTTAVDVNPENNQHVLFYVPVHPPAEVVAEIYFPRDLNPDGTLTIRYEIRNQHVEYPAVLIAKIGIPEAVEIVRTNADCRGDAANLECRLPAPASTTFPLEITVRLPEASGRVTSTVRVFWEGYPEFAQALTRYATYTRYFFVTTTADDGPGSLRSTIVDANLRCVDGVPCRVQFAIDEPVPSDGWFTIRPLTVLPAVTVQGLTIDAAMQPDTNPLGPEVLLDGSALVVGSGLELNGGGNAINGFAIGQFADAGVTGVGFTVTASYIGVDPSGTRAMPNGRGIVVNGASASIARSVVSGNRHSGVAAWNVYSMQVYENRIGVAAASDDPIPNGASGVFIGSSTAGWFAVAGVYRNVIANNAHFGVAFPRSVWGYVGPNRIENNGLLGVDIDLDGPSPDFGPVPVITRAYWDGTGTVIEGTTPPWTTGSISLRYGVLLYANRQLEPGGYAEGERHFGTLEADQFGRFNLRYSGDLRGMYVNGMLITRTNFYGELEQSRTSEFGQAILVTEQP